MKLMTVWSERRHWIRYLDQTLLRAGPGTANIFISFNSRLGERQRINEVVLGNSQVKPKQHVQNSSFTCKTAPARATRALCALITGQ